MLLHENNHSADANGFFVASQALPESEKLLQLLEHQKLIQTSLDGFLVVRTKDGSLVEANDAFCNMVGYSREELLTMCISDLEADESPAETATHIQKVMDVGHDRFETRHRHKQGHLIDIEISVSHSATDGGMNVAFVRDITERKRTEEALYFVAQRGWMGGAENFFDALAQYLGKTLGVDYVVIDRLDKTPGVAETVALYAKGEIVPNLRYELKGTPCENVMGRKFCFYPQGIQQLFPDDILLVEMGAESYAGIPLWDSFGLPIGLIAVIDSKPLADEAAISRLLQLVAIRVAVELERDRSDFILREREREFRSLAENSPDNIVRYDRDGRVIYLNPVLEQTLGIAAARMIGKHPREIHPDGSYGTYAQTIENTIVSGEDGEIELTFPGGIDGVRIHHVRMVAERDEGGEVIGVLAIGRDITERKRMEQAIAAREQEFRSLAESSLDSIIRYDLDGRIRYLNYGLLNYFGLSASDVIGKLPGEVWLDERYAEIDRAIALALETGKPTTVEFCGADAAGKLIFSQVNVIPERDIAGQIIGAIGYGRDVTAIREAERKLKHFIDNLPGMAYTFRRSPDGHGCFPFISPSVEKFYGLKPEDVQDDMAPLHSCWHPDDQMHIEAAAAESARTMTPFRIEARVCRPGQPERWLEGRALPEREADGGILWYGLLLDITERKQAETLLKERLCQIEELNSNLGESARNLREQTEELAASQEHLKQTETWYRSILHSAPDGMLVADARGVITQVNAQIEAMFGYAASELVGQPVELLLPPDVREDHVGMRADFVVATAGYNPKSTKARGLRGYRKDGTEFPVDVSLSRLPDTDEKVGHVCAAIRDITERTKMEQERINHLSRLAEVSHSLVAAQEDARQRLACELHDRTSPNLAAIDINLNVIAAEIAKGASTDLTERMEDIRALISDTAASIREIGAEMRPPLLDYAGLIAAMENYALLFARRTGILVYFECENRDTRYTPQTESLLFRIFQEALTNCAKHSSARSIRISLCNEIHPNILTIADDGAGFDPAQLSETRKIGLGLLNMREMAEVAGVKIAIESTIGKGTCITVKI